MCTYVWCMLMYGRTTTRYSKAIIHQLEIKGVLKITFNLKCYIIFLHPTTQLQLRVSQFSFLLSSPPNNPSSSSPPILPPTPNDLSRVCVKTEVLLQQLSHVISQLLKLCNALLLPDIREQIQENSLHFVFLLRNYVNYVDLLFFQIFSFQFCKISELHQRTTKVPSILESHTFSTCKTIDLTGNIKNITSTNHGVSIKRN